MAGDSALDEYSRRASFRNPGCRDYSRAGTQPIPRPVSPFANHQLETPLSRSSEYPPRYLLIRQSSEGCCGDLVGPGLTRSENPAWSPLPKVCARYITISAPGRHNLEQTAVVSRVGDDTIRSHGPPHPGCTHPKHGMWQSSVHDTLPWLSVAP